MNREQKAAAIDEIAAQIAESPGDLRRRLPRHLRAPGRGAARQAARGRRDLQGRQELAHRTRRRPGRRRELKALLAGPTALTFVRGDTAAAAKAIADYGSRHAAAAVQGRPDGRRRARRRADPLDLAPALARSPLRPARRRRRLARQRARAHARRAVGGLAVALGQVRDEEGVRRDPRGRGRGARARPRRRAADGGRAG